MPEPNTSPRSSAGCDESEHRAKRLVVEAREALLGTLAAREAALAAVSAAYYQLVPNELSSLSAASLSAAGAPSPATNRGAPHPS